MKNLKEKWGVFFGMVLDPWFLIFTLATVTALVVSSLVKNNTTSNLLAVFASITGGIAGGIFQGAFTRASGESTLEKKGQSAVRNLSAIKTQVASLRSWGLDFMKTAGKVAQRPLEEIDRHLSTIELNVESGYEDWIDILPQLREGKEIAQKFDEVLRVQLTELLDQRLKLSQSRDNAERTSLGVKIDQLEKQLEAVKRDRVRTPWVSGATGSTIASGLLKLPWSESLRVFRCDNCGKPLTYTTLGGRTICDDCRAKGIK